MKLLIERHGHEPFAVEVDVTTPDDYEPNDLIAVEAFGEHAQRLLSLGESVFHVTMGDAAGFAMVRQVAIRPYDAAFIFSLAVPSR